MPIRVGVTEVSWQSGRSSRQCPGELGDPAFMLLRAADGTLATLELFLNAQYGYTTQCEVVSEFGSRRPGPADRTQPRRGETKR
jgi:myo-inositol 2-dehydrogenase/D-chiro-inositol 1-dehydrogenase